MSPQKSLIFVFFDIFSRFISSTNQLGIMYVPTILPSFLQLTNLFKYGAPVEICSTTCGEDLQILKDWQKAPKKSPILSDLHF